MGPILSNVLHVHMYMQHAHAHVVHVHVHVHVHVTCPTGHLPPSTSDEITPKLRARNTATEVALKSYTSTGR